MHDPEQHRAWFNRNVRPWLARSPATHNIRGNHDWCGQEYAFPYDSPARGVHNDLQILVDEGTTGPHPGSADGRISVWASPWSNRFMRWALMKRPSDLARVYATIARACELADRKFAYNSGTVVWPRLVASVAHWACGQ